MYGRTDLALRLRTLQGNAWLHVSWHPVASRVCVGSEPPRGAIAEGFTLAEQLSDNLNGLVLVDATMPQVGVTPREVRTDRSLSPVLLGGFLAARLGVYHRIGFDLCTGGRNGGGESRQGYKPRLVPHPDGLFGICEPCPTLTPYLSM